MSVSTLRKKPSLAKEGMLLHAQSMEDQEDLKLGKCDRVFP
jgi:hypothetical protein